MSLLQDCSGKISAGVRGTELVGEIGQLAGRFRQCGALLGTLSTFLDHGTAHHTPRLTYRFFGSYLR